MTMLKSQIHKIKQEFSSKQSNLSNQKQFQEEGRVENRQLNK